MYSHVFTRLEINHHISITPRLAKGRDHSTDAHIPALSYILERITILS